MKTTKLLILSISILLILVNCKKKDNDAVSPIPKCDPVSFITSTGKSSFKIEYNADGTKSKLIAVDTAGNVLPAFYREYKYNNGKLVLINNNWGEDQNSAAISYNNDNLISEIKEYDNINGTGKMYRSYKYYYQNRDLKNRIKYYYEETSITNKDSIVFTGYNNGRPTLEEEYSYNYTAKKYELQSKERFSYDNNWNLSKVERFNASKGIFEVVYEASYNQTYKNLFSFLDDDSQDPNTDSRDRNANLIASSRSYTTYCNGGSSATPVVQEESTYTVTSVNEQGYPLNVKEVSSNKCGGADQTLSYKVTYNCK